MNNFSIKLNKYDFFENLSSFQPINVKDIATDFTRSQIGVAFQEMFNSLRDIDERIRSISTYGLATRYNSDIDQLTYNNCASIGNAATTFLKCKTGENNPIGFYFEPRKIGYVVRWLANFYLSEKMDCKLNERDEVSCVTSCTINGRPDLAKTMEDVFFDSVKSGEDIAITKVWKNVFPRAIYLGGTLLTTSLAIYTMARILNQDLFSKKVAFLWTIATISTLGFFFNNSKS